jgi:hypothetical protein
LHYLLHLLEKGFLMQRKARLIALAVALAAFLISCVSGPGEIMLQPVEKDKEIGRKLEKTLQLSLASWMISRRQTM